ncbi:MAG: hypothetical protein J07HX64_00821 [halophilic archaeon J07HX64]|nr:MAG: hypothetical protein J07HX64_00821 [halophilic archaeon J07HX64]
MTADVGCARVDEDSPVSVDRPNLL